jgi:hypothetical protein
MAISVPRSLVEFILLGPEDDRRQLQDSPVLGDVWVEFAKNGSERLSLLITPYSPCPASIVAGALSRYRFQTNLPPQLGNADIAFLQGIVAATMSFVEVIRFVVPMTNWWSSRKIANEIERYRADPQTLFSDIQRLLSAARAWTEGALVEAATPMRDMGSHIRYIVLGGLIIWARGQNVEDWEEKSTKAQTRYFLKVENLEEAIAQELVRVFAMLQPPERNGLVWTVSMNRRATPAVTKSVPAVKGDAVQNLFKLNCSSITWAMLDSGIDAKHLAFRDAEGQSRVRKTFDFTKIRQIVSLDNRYDEEGRNARAAELLARRLKHEHLTAEQVSDLLRRLAERAEDDRTIIWELVEPLIEIETGVEPAAKHGTHVAGILGARMPKAGDSWLKMDSLNLLDDWSDGMCPDINIYDFRVLGPDLIATEFAIIAALQYIRYVNDRNGFMTIHGANLSLSIPHDVRNYACGLTPVCIECERLVSNGAVVVAAAGNRGYQNFETKDGLYEGYAAFSITDPGNAEGVITVGATHRYWPHTYGISYFSSRGPTGDGRLKPDLVAPGERIRAPFPNNQWGDLDGTSMAAPHVSGAAAMLMARYPELIGQPRRIKQILCDSATDLGRERTFQGRGMLDVLRAFQSV